MEAALLTLAGLTPMMGSWGDSTLFHLSPLPAGQSRHFPKKYALPLLPDPSRLGHRCFPSYCLPKQITSPAKEVQGLGK